MEAQVALDRQVEVERGLLEDHADVAQRRHGVTPDRAAGDAGLAGIGDEQAGEQLEQRRLAGAVRAEQGHETAGKE